jgi:DNA anti-recombination protein RmuC
VSEKLSEDTHQSFASAAAGFEQHAASLLRTVDQAHADLQTQVAARDEQRLSAWTQALAAMATSLQQEWQQAGAHTAERQQQLFETLAQTARDMSTQAEAHAKSTVAEIAQLLQAASDAPRVAAEVVAELRQKLSDSMARDNAMLEERSRLMETLGTLLDAVNHASTEQRSAVDALVGASADVLERVGSRFTDKVEAETGKMAGVAAQITGSAVEVASLGEAFGLAVQLFSESNDKLVAHLQRVEGALGKSMARSDEQLAYYVAQAREVIDLSIMSQKQIVEDLQQIAGRQQAVASEA